MERAADRDWAAARRVLGLNPQIKDLPGARECKHELMRDGRPLADNLILQPYKHHIYIRQDPDRHNQYCKCGNSQNNPVHDMCWAKTKEHSNV